MSSLDPFRDGVLYAERIGLENIKPLLKALIKISEDPTLAKEIAQQTVLSYYKKNSEMHQKVCLKFGEVK